MSRITGWLAAAAVLAGAAGTLVAALPGSTASTTATAPTWFPSLTRQPAACIPDGLACQPYMGWDTYYGLGAGITQGEVEQQAQAMVHDGLAPAGYRYVWLDVGWWHGKRNPGTGEIQPAAGWNMTAFTSYIHSLHLLAGIYTDAGKNGCGWPGAGSYGHYEKDVQQFEDWGFDAVKVDFCGLEKMKTLDPAVAYQKFAAAIRASGKPLLLAICNFFTPSELLRYYPHASYQWRYQHSAYYSSTFGPASGNSWRTDTDIAYRPSGEDKTLVSWADMIRNLRADAAHPATAGPGHWNDPDYLLPGIDIFANLNRARAQFGMWAMLAAPLVISSDMKKLSPQLIGMLTNKQVIAVDQDPLGIQGRRVATQHSTGEVWVKPLIGGDWAVALFNTGTSPLTMQVTPDMAGMPSAASYTWQDLWNHDTFHNGPHGTVTVTVPARSAILYRVFA
jgi:alpha-galactosidase